MQRFLIPFSLSFFTVLLAAQVQPVLTRSANNLRTGVYQETLITPANVNKLHKLYTISIPNDKRGIESQPLVLPGVKGSDGVTRDLIILSTMANDVIACDLKDGKQIWITNLGRPIDNSKAIDFWFIQDHWGVASTGVIDPDTKTWYGVAWSSPDGQAKNGWHSLHSVDLTTGKENKPPLSMNPLTYDPGKGLPVQKFAGQMRKQRSALLLETIGGRKVVFFAAGGVLEVNGAASGWVSAADIDAWRFTASWSSTSRYSGAGIWMAGQGITSDAQKNLYLISGNGSFDGITDFGECFLKLKYNPPSDPKTQMGSIQPVDWWSPYSDAGRIGKDPTLAAATLQPKLAGTNSSTQSGGKIQPIEPVNQDSSHHAQMAPKVDFSAWGDEDLGSGGIAVIPQYNVIVGGGKDGIGYSVRMDNMGKTMPQDFASPAKNYAKLLAPPFWLTFACFKHDSKGQVIGYEDAAPNDVTRLNFNYGNKTHHLHGSPLVFDSKNLGKMLFEAGENSNLRAWKVNPDGSLKFLGNGQELASPLSTQGGMTGMQLAISSDNGANGIVWALSPDYDSNKQITPGKIYAYDAQNLGQYPDGSGWVKTLWSVPLSAHPKFNTPIVTAGKLLVPTYQATLEVYGLQ